MQGNSFVSFLCLLIVAVRSKGCSNAPCKHMFPNFCMCNSSCRADCTLALCMAVGYVLFSPLLITSRVWIPGCPDCNQFIHSPMQWFRPPRFGDHLKRFDRHCCPKYMSAHLVISQTAGCFAVGIIDVCKQKMFKIPSHCGAWRSLLSCTVLAACRLVYFITRFVISVVKNNPKVSVHQLWPWHVEWVPGLDLC